MHVDRAYCGSFMTSLQMAGVSVTIMQVNERVKQLLGRQPFTCTAVLISLHVHVHVRIAHSLSLLIYTYMYLVGFPDAPTTAVGWQPAYLNSNSPDRQTPSLMTCHLDTSDKAASDGVVINKGTCARTIVIHQLFRCMYSNCTFYTRC